MHVTPPVMRPCRLVPASSRIRPVMHVRDPSQSGWEWTMSLEEAEAFHAEFAAQLQVCRRNAPALALERDAAR